MGWNYLPKAAGLAAKIKEACGIEPELIGGSNGIFDIAVNGQLIYSKFETGVFPDEEKIVESVKNAL